jgi:tetratricopeptide (TPR) repeat protein
MSYQAGPSPILNLERVVCGLEWAMKSLQIDRAKRVLEKLRQTIEGQPTGLPHLHGYAPRVLISFAEATDFDESYLPLIKNMAFDLQKSNAGLLIMNDVQRIDIANALIDFYEGRHDKAKLKLEFAMPAIDRTGDADLKCTARYFLARSYSREGDYKNGLEFLSQAKECDLQVEGSKRVAVIEILEGYLLFLKDRIKEGRQVLEHAKEVLEGTTDRINLAMVRSFQGQFCRRAGDYDEALEHFRAADKIYRKIAISHRKRARCLMNMAVVLRLMALRMQKERSVKVVKEYLDRSLGHLKEAEAIYNISPDRFHRNLSKYHYIRALLHLDNGELPDARLEARLAHILAEENEDNIGMARARIAQCIIALDQDSSENTKRAHRFALEAIHYAEQTQYSRVKARAFIWLAKTLLRPLYNNPQEADGNWHEADKYLAPEHKDYLRDELELLRAEIDNFEGPAVIVGSEADIDTLRRSRWKGLSLDKIVQEIVKSEIRNNPGKTKREIAEDLNISPGRLRRILNDDLPQ